LIYSDFQPFPSQEEAIRSLLVNKRLLLALPTGAGKSFCILYSYGFLKERILDYHILIVSTASSAVQWDSEIEKLTHGFSREVLVKRSPAERKKFFNSKTFPDIVVTNYEVITREHEALTKMLSRGNWVLCLDESHSFKGSGTALDKAIMSIHQNVGYAYGWLASATPVQNRYEELFNQMKFLNPNVIPTWADFYRDFCVRRKIRPAGSRFDIEITVGYKNIDRLIRLVSPYLYCKSKEELLLPFPKEETIYHSYDVSEEFKRIHKAVLNGEQAAEGIEKEWTHSKFTSLIYSQLFSNHPEYFGVSLTSPKFYGLKELINQELAQGSRVLVYSHYKATVNYLSENIGLPHTTITGDVPIPDRMGILRDFWADRFPLIFMNAAGGQSLNLQKANCFIFYDLPWSYGDYTQCVGRIVRIGSPWKNVRVHVLTNKDSIDNYKYKVLSDKAKRILSIGQELETDIQNHSYLDHVLNPKFLEANQETMQEISKEMKRAA